MNGKQLKNSILQWAIQGKLVPQDPNDEPASVLLERIRQEKERLIKEKKIKRDKNASIIYRGEDNSYYEKFIATGEVKCINEEIPFEIPNGWEWCRVSSLFQINPKVVAKDDAIAAFIPMEAISAGYGSDFRYYEKKWKEIKSGYTSFADNDIAFAKITPCFQNRKSVILKGLPNGIGAGTTELKILRTYGETLNRWFVLYFLESPYFIDEAIFKGTANQQRIIVGYLENKLFPLPSLAEQERIVAKIKLVMPIIDKYSKYQEHLNKMNTELNESLKKSILQEAIQGKLVPQVQTEGTAQELLEQIRQEKEQLVKEGKLKKSALTDSVIFKGDDNKYFEKKGKTEKDITEEIPFEIPDSWAWVRLSSISDIIGGYAFQSSSLKEKQGKRVIRISDFSEQGFVNTKIVRYDGTPISAIYKLRRFDILMAMTGGTVGKSLFIRELPETEILLNQRVARIRSLWINVDYLYFVIIAPHVKEFICKQKNSTNDNISMTDISNFIIPLPPIKEQIRIVKKLYNLASIMRG